MPVEIFEPPFREEDLATGLAVVGAKGDPGSVGEYGYNAITTASVTVPSGTTPVSIAVNPAYFLTDGNSVRGSLSGIDGTIARSGNSYTFTRAASGSATTAPAGTAFVPMQSLNLAIHLSNMQALRDYPVPGVDGLVFKIKGYYTALDIQMPEYQWVAASTKPHNGGTVIRPTAIATDSLPGRYEASLDTVDPKQFGAKDDGVYDSTNAIEYCLQNFRNVNFSGTGTYLITRSIDISFNGNEGTQVYRNRKIDFGLQTYRFTGTGYCFGFIRVGNNPRGAKYQILNGRFDGQSTQTSYAFFRLRDCGNTTLQNNEFMLLPKGVAILIQNWASWSENLTIRDLKCSDVDIPIRGQGQTVISGAPGNQSSGARLRVENVFAAGFSYFFDCDRWGPYNALFNMIAGNGGDTCKAIFRWRGPCTGTVIRNVNVEQTYRHDIGTTSTVANCTMLAEDNVVTTTVAGAFTGKEGYLLTIPEVGAPNKYGNPKDGGGRIKSVSLDGTQATLSPDDAALNTATNKTVTLANTNICSFDNSNLYRLNAVAGAFNSADLDYVIRIEAGGPGNTPWHTTIQSIAPDGSYAILTDPALTPASGFSCSTGTVIAIVTGKPNGPNPPQPTFYDVWLSHKESLGEVVYVQGNNPMDTGTIEHRNTLVTPTHFAQTTFDRELCGMGDFSTPTGYAYLAGGMRDTENGKLGFFGAFNLAGLDNKSNKITGFTPPAGLEIRSGDVFGNLRAMLVAVKNFVLVEVLGIFEDGSISLEAGSQRLGLPLGNMSASNQHLVLLAPYGVADQATSAVGRIYGTRATNTDNGTGAVNISYQIGVGKSGVPTLNYRNWSTGPQNIAPVTCTYGGKTWVALQIGGSNLEGLANEGGVFADIKGKAFPQMILASAATEITTYLLSAQARDTFDLSFASKWGLFGTGGATRQTLTGNNQDLTTVTSQLRAALAAYGLITDSTTAQGVAPVDAPTTIGTVVQIREDFIMGLGACKDTASGSGATVALNNSSISDPGGNPGWVALETGTTTTGRAALAPLATAFKCVALGYGSWVWETLIQIPTLSDATNTFSYLAGALDDITAYASIVDGLFFYYTHSVNSGKFQFVAESNSVSTVIDTGVTVAPNTNYKLRIEINANATQAIAYINGAVVATVTANIPVGGGGNAGRNLGFGEGIIKSAGTTNRIILVDYFLLTGKLTTAR